MDRDPSVDRNPLDRASFYIESLKFRSGPDQIESLTEEDIVGQLETLLREAGVTSMTGQQLWQASKYYGESFTVQIGAPLTITLSMWVDGIMHGIALAAGIEGEYRNPKEGR